MKDRVSEASISWEGDPPKALARIFPFIVVALAVLFRSFVLKH